MSKRLDARSERALVGVHPDLVAVARRAGEIMPGGFTLTEGMRSKERQRQLFAKGLSKTMNSRHLYGLAVDFAPLIDTDGDGDKEVTWKTPAFLPVIKAFKRAASELGVPIVSGGDWKTFKDYPHIELSRAVYK
jgi:peptidoglycan L-alanyl-D-glutamate endopeptidase CwlK